MDECRGRETRKERDEDRLCRVIGPSYRFGSCFLRRSGFHIESINRLQGKRDGRGGEGEKLLPAGRVLSRERALLVCWLWSVREVESRAAAGCRERGGVECFQRKFGHVTFETYFRLMSGDLSCSMEV